MIRNSGILLKSIGWLQVFGGISGLISVCDSLLKTDKIIGPTLLIFLIAIALFVFSIYAGKMLLRKDASGLHFSAINQFLQVIQFSIMGYGWSYNSGPQLSVGIKSFAFTCDASVFLSSFHLYYNSYQPFFLKLNLIALAAFILLSMVTLKKQL